MIRSPLRYPGGKSRAIERIVALVPPFKEYREPFVGGASIFISLRQRFPEKKFWINDKYTELINFWRKSQTDSETVLKQVRFWKNDISEGRRLFYFLRENQENFSEIEKAAAFFVLNRITFSGTTEAGGFSVQAFEKRFTDSSIERLAQISPLLKDVEITDLDYEEVVLRRGENVFLFLDPPYFSTTNSALYGKNGNLHKTFDHERFAVTMKKCPHRWLLTYDDSSFVRQLFSFAKITNWNLMYGMRNQTSTSNQKGNELFISNYAVNFNRQEKLAFAG